MNSATGRFEINRAGEFSFIFIFIRASIAALVCSAMAYGLAFQISAPKMRFFAT